MSYHPINLGIRLLMVLAALAAAAAPGVGKMVKAGCISCRHMAFPS